jgi:hypothetical protein
MQDGEHGPPLSRGLGESPGSRRPVEFGGHIGKITGCAKIHVDNGDGVRRKRPQG